MVVTSTESCDWPDITKSKHFIRLKAPRYLLLGLFPWSIFRIHRLFNNKWFITVKSMPVSNLMMVESLLFGLISKFGMYTGLGKILLSQIITQHHYYIRLQL